MTEKQRRFITTEDLYDIELVSDPRISPRGDQIIYCLTRVDRESEKKFSSLWLVPVDGGQPRAFTSGDHVDTMPRWSPNGQEIAFLSNRHDEKQKQIHIIPLGGGEARKVSRLNGEFRTLQWSPDGLKLLCQFRKKDQEAIEREEDEKKKELGIVSRQIKRVFFRFDGEGYLPEERWHIWSIEARSSQAKQFTFDLEYEELSPTWSPDGKQIAFISNRSADPDLDPDATDIYLLPAGGGMARKVETPFGYKESLCFSPDGKWLAYVGQVGRGNWWQNSNLWTVPIDGSEDARNLTGEHDIYVGNATLGDIADRPTVPPIWTADGGSIWFQLSRHGNTSLHSINLATGKLDTIVSDDGVVGSWSVNDNNSIVAYAFTSPMNPGQIYTVGDDGANVKKLTTANEQILGDITLSDVEEVWFKGADDNDLQGWIIKPPDFEANRQYPSILEIHGGPYLQYGSAFFHEFQYLAAQGYVVYLCNPRGGQGYGEAHGKAIHAQWGTVDYEDLMAWTDFIEKQPYIDPDRMGVAGGSYGGYMSTWIIGHTDRFKAAVAQRVVSNTTSFVGSSDVNWVFHDPWGDGKPPWEDLENYWRQSPMAYIGNAKTPTMIIHSEQDMRCDPEQGTQVFVALKWLGVDTELILFPEESHGLSRGGRTDRRIVRLEHMARWFDKYLKE